VAIVCVSSPEQIPGLGFCVWVSLVYFWEYIFIAELNESLPRTMIILVSELQQLWSLNNYDGSLTGPKGIVVLDQGLTQYVEGEWTVLSNCHAVWFFTSI
jgi:hypothetical protein